MGRGCRDGLERRRERDDVSVFDILWKWQYMY